MIKETRQFTINGKTVETEVEVHTFTYNDKHSCEECARWKKQGHMFCPAGYFEDDEVIEALEYETLNQVYKEWELK